MINAKTLDDLKGKGRDEVRRYVRAMLEQTPSYGNLATDERRGIANSLVQVLTYLTDPAAGREELRGAARRERPIARPLDIQKQEQQSTKARDAFNQRMAEKPGFAGQDFRGGATSQAGEAFETLAKAVDFPKFVSSLIEGVFTSIVNSSIKQMHEFGKFLNAVVMSLGDFAAQNVNLDEARDHLASKYPRYLKTEKAGGGRKKLVPLPGADDEGFPDFKSLFNMEDDVDLDDEEGEKQVAEAAQLELARMRQKQLSTLVLMGINRIVVTEGEIKASVVFDVSSSDVAHRDNQAAMQDAQTHADWEHQYQYQRNKSFWGTSGSGSGSSSSEVNTRITSASAVQNETSDSRLESKAKLTGFVQVKFKSETFPLERMASQTDLDQVQGKAAR
jgi:hypothetical protein